MQPWRPPWFLDLEQSQVTWRSPLAPYAFLSLAPSFNGIGAYPGHAARRDAYTVSPRPTPEALDNRTVDEKIAEVREYLDAQAARSAGHSAPIADEPTAEALPARKTFGLPIVDDLLGIVRDAETPTSSTPTSADPIADPAPILDHPTGSIDLAADPIETTAFTAGHAAPHEKYPAAPVLDEAPSLFNTAAACSTLQRDDRPTPPTTRRKASKPHKSR